MRRFDAFNGDGDEVTVLDIPIDRNREALMRLLGRGARVRSPAGPPDAAQFCQRFPTGGGRARAAGLQDLPGDRLEEFLDALAAAWQR